ncbi:retrotransposon protein [Cucumis melo var. makuwa]|uniref:Retrotransposon protein n=1 Tax=Cucumis melo var. makuwa TaxID=1194695 RepID=A0A5D3BTT4_CUCMM|nr:retrotransposon protein [Cucumis melo var. makuwa]
MVSSSRLPKHNWTKEEEAGLVECLVELVNADGWRSDNGTFQPEYLNQLARMITFKIPAGVWVESFADVGSNDSARYEAFVTDAALDTNFQLMYVSSGSKRKRGGQAADSGDILRTAIEYGNEQLNCIAEWPVLQHQDASQIRQEVVRQLEAIPELTLMDRCRLMRILMHNVDDMKAFLEVPDNMKYLYCNIILQENG